MAMVVPPTNDRKRVKVYELRNNDWFDRGTGFCTGQNVNDESKILVESEDHPDRILLETRIQKDDGYQKQQETLIVWTESNGTDMALSFQEAEGCAAIWDFVSQVQQQLLQLAGPDDALSDDAIDNFPNPVMLPPPELGNLAEIDHQIRTASTSQQGRESLTKFLLAEEYVRRLVPLVEMAEDLEDLPDLHRLSGIMKMLILLNDTQIIEMMVSDGVVLGVVGALEYDHEFPQHKANHRQYLQNKSRFKEVVPINDENITKKIHATWRLQYLKDVVLARILDDPTFGVLNSLIFFNQVDIVTHLQQSPSFLKDLFSLIDGKDTSPARRKDAVCFIQQCCAIAKNLQPQARQSLYGSFVRNGLLNVIVYALGQHEAPVRIAGTDILVAMIDHDPAMVRSHILKALTEKRTPLTDTLIDLLLIEADLGVKAQAADAIKVLLDPQQAPPEQMGPRVSNEQQFIAAKYRNNPAAAQQTDSFVHDFYENGAKRLFQPLKDLEKRESVKNLSFNEVSLYCHLVDILIYFVRQHLYRSKFFIANESLTARIGQLLGSSQKHMKLTALKFFRTCLAIGDDFYYTQLTQNHIFGPILDIVYDSLPRDNLLNSACLEMFEYIRRESVKPVVLHVVGNYRQRLQEINYVDVFEQLIACYDRMQGYVQGMENTLFSQDDDDTPVRTKINGASQRWQGAHDLDAEEEQYFNTSDDEDELAAAKPKPPNAMANGASPLMKPLVDYPDDEDELGPSRFQSFYHKPPDDAPQEMRMDGGTENIPPSPKGLPLPSTPPERVAEKRRREEDDEDELGKLSLTKRRSSAVSTSSAASSGNGPGGSFLRRKKSFSTAKDAPPSKKMTISLSVKSSSPIETDRKSD